MLDKIQKELQKRDTQSRQNQPRPQNPEAKRVAVLLQSVRSKGTKK